MKVRVRLEKDSRYTLGECITATIVKYRKRGCVEKRFISKAKLKELDEYGICYVNLPKEFVV